jgi:MFS family permease
MQRGGYKGETKMVSGIGGNRWAVLATIIGVRVAITIQVQSVGALGPALLADPGLNLGYSGLGMLIGAYSLPGILVALPSGWLAVRLGEQRMVLFGLALAVIGGIALATASDFALAFAARLIAGAGSALLSVVLSAMVMARFTGAALAPAMGGFLAAYPFGIGLTLVALPALAAAVLSWRTAMLVVAAGCALAAVPFVLTPRAPRVAPATRPGLTVED